MYSDQQHNPFVKVDYDQSEGMSRIVNNVKRPILNNKPKLEFEDKKSANYLLKKNALKYQLFQEYQEKEKGKKKNNSSSPDLKKSVTEPSNTNTNISSSPFKILNKKKEIPSVFDVIDDKKEEEKEKDYSMISSNNLDKNDKFMKLNKLLKERKPVVTAASTMVEKDYLLLGNNLNENFDIFEVGSDEESLEENMASINLHNNSTQQLNKLKKLNENDQNFLSSLIISEEGSNDNLNEEDKNEEDINNNNYFNKISFFPLHTDDNLSIKSNYSLSLELYKKSLEKKKIINDDYSEYSNHNPKNSQLNLLSLTESSMIMNDSNSMLLLKNNEENDYNENNGSLTIYEKPMRLLNDSSYSLPQNLSLINDSKDEDWTRLVDISNYNILDDDDDLTVYDQEKKDGDEIDDNDSLSLVPAPVLNFKLHKDDLEANILQLKNNISVEVSELDATNFNNRKEAHLHFLRNSRSKYNLKTLKSIIDLKALPHLEEIAKNDESEKILPNYNIKNSSLPQPTSLNSTSTSTSHLPSSPFPTKNGTSSPSTSSPSDTGGPLSKVNSFLSPVKLIKSLTKNKQSSSPETNSSPQGSREVSISGYPSSQPLTRPSTTDGNNLSTFGSFFKKLNPLKKEESTENYSENNLAQMLQAQADEEARLKKLEKERIEKQKKLEEAQAKSAKGLLGIFENILSKYTTVEEIEQYDIKTIPFINRPQTSNNNSPSISYSPSTITSSLPPKFEQLNPFQTNYIYKTEEEKLKDLKRKENNYNEKLMDRQEFLASHGQANFLDPNQVDLTRPSDIMPVITSTGDVKTLNSYDISLNYEQKKQEIKKKHFDESEVTEEKNGEIVVNSAEDILRIVEEELQSKHSDLYQQSNEEIINSSSYASPFSSPLPNISTNSSPLYHSPSPALSSSFYSPALESSSYFSPNPNRSNSISLSPIPIKKELSPIKTPRSKYYPNLSETDQNRPAYGNAALYQDDDDQSHATMTSFPPKSKSFISKLNSSHDASVPQLLISSPTPSSPLPSSTSIGSVQSSVGMTLTPPLTNHSRDNNLIFSDNESEEDIQTPHTPISVTQIEENLSIQLSERASEDISRSLKNYPSLSKMIFKKDDKKNSVTLPSINSPVKAPSISSVSTSISGTSLVSPNYSKPFEPKVDIRDDILGYLGNTNSKLYEPYKDYYSSTAKNSNMPLITNGPGENSKLINPKKKLEEIMKKRYSKDQEGELENKNKAKQHLLEGYAKQTKINKEYLDLLEDW